MKLKKFIAIMLSIILVFTYFSLISSFSFASAASVKKSGEASTIKEHGIDVSKHNGSINWEKVKKSGVDFAIIRAGYSHTVDNKVDITIDKKFNENYEGAKKSGIKVGVYLYSYATTVQQAREDAFALAEFIKGKKFEYPIYYDMEDDCQANLTTSLRTQIAYAFMTEMKAKGYYAGVYANEYWYKSKLTYERLLETGAIWFAKWRSNNKADINYCEYGLWQYSNNGKVDGISGRVDLNVSFVNYSKIIKNSGLNGFGEDSENMYVYPIYSVVYEGKPVTPEAYIQVGNTTLRKNIDYTVTYYNNDRAGVAVAVYNGINSFKGYFGRQMFTVRRRSISYINIKKISSREYTGSEIKPNYTLTDYNNKLKKNRDYKISYKNNKALGTATVTITGINYVGTKTTTFKIKKRNVKNCTVTAVNNLVYNGKTRKFSGLKLKIGTKTVPSSYYTVKYSNNKNIGKASVTITAKNKNFTGTVKKTFKIIPKSVENLKATVYKENSVKLKWKKVSNCDGYTVYRKTANGSYKKTATLKGKTKTVLKQENLTEGTQFYKVYAYKKVKGKNYLSNPKTVRVKIKQKQEDLPETLQ